MVETPRSDTTAARRRLSFKEIRDYQDDEMAFMLRAAKEQGGLARFKMAWINMTVVTNPDLIRELMVKRPLDLHRDPFTTKVLGRIMGDGVFIAEGADWQRQRKLVQPAFHAKRISQYAATMAEYTAEMCAGWPDEAVVAVDRELTELTLRIIAQTMFNIDLGDQTSELGTDMQTILEVGEAQLDMTFVPPPWLPTALNRRQNPALARVRGRMHDIVRERMGSGADEGDLLSMLVMARDDEGRPMDEDAIVDECMTLLVAGHETTAVLLSWIWVLLGQHPETVAQLLAEVDRVCGGRPVTFEMLPDLVWTEMIVKEALRLYPPAFGVGRTPVRDIVVEGHELKRGELIMISIYALQRLAEFYADPEQFRPERWAEGEPPPPRYAYMPFGAGPRICLGNMFAMMEAQVILATMVQQVRLAPQIAGEVEAEPVITLRPKGPLLFVVGRRDESSLGATESTTKDSRI